MWELRLQSVARIRLLALFAKSERNQLSKRQHAILCEFSAHCAPSANASRRWPCPTAALASMTLDGAHTAREFLTSSRQVSRRARAAHAGKARWERTRAPNLTETWAAAWRGITPAILLEGFPASPPEHASANEKMLLHRVVPCVAVDPMLRRIGPPGHREGSGRATSSTLTVPGKRN